MEKKYCFTKLAFQLIILCFMPVSILLAQNETDDSIEIDFNSCGDNIHGWFYKAKEKEFSSTVILLHSYCGKDFLIFELAHVLAENGFIVLTFNYSGKWLSKGIWSPETSLNNVKSEINSIIITWLKR